MVDLPWSGADGLITQSIEFQSSEVEVCELSFKVSFKVHYRLSFPCEM